MATVKMRLGDIEERRALNPREHLPHDRIQEYVRMFQNGETPEPLQVHATKRVLFAGALRFHAWKEFLGEGWENHEVDVVLRDDIPDPDDDPETFRVIAAGDNRHHGQPMTRYERRVVAAGMAGRHGAEAALQYAKVLNETPETLHQLLATLERPTRVLLEATEIVSATETEAPVPTVTETEQPVSRSVKYPTGTFPTGHLQGYVPPIRRYCRMLQMELKRAGDLTDVDRQELQQTVEAITAALAKGEAA